VGHAAAYLRIKAADLMRLADDARNAGVAAQLRGIATRLLLEAQRIEADARRDPLTGVERDFRRRASRTA
jgi:hypothetical protein